MYCTNCGNKIEEKAKFCTHCGAPIKNTVEGNFSEEKEVNSYEVIEIDRNGHYKTSSSKNKWFDETTKIRLWAILFGFFYYTYKGLWKKGLLLYASSLLFGIVLVILAGLFNWNENTFFMLRRLFFISLYGKMGPIDIYREKHNNETMWKELPSIFSKAPVIIAAAVVALIFNGLII